MHIATLELLLASGLCACQAAPAQPARESPPGELLVAAPKFAKSRPGPAPLEVKRQGCEERLKAAEAGPDFTRVEVTLSGPPGSRAAEYDAIRARLLSGMRERPLSVTAAEGMVSMSVGALGIRELCASPDVLILRAPQHYDPQ
jgi:hypothetical protein